MMYNNQSLLLSGKIKIWAQSEEKFTDQYRGYEISFPPTTEWWSAESVIPQDYSTEK